MAVSFHALRDVFNLLTGCYNPDALGIDPGITMLMAENGRSGFVWDTFMKNKDAGGRWRKRNSSGSSSRLSVFSRWEEIALSFVSSCVYPWVTNLLAFPPKKFPLSC
jgi:hypothetical protein